MQLTGQTRPILIAVGGAIVLSILYFSLRPAERQDKDPVLANVDRLEQKKDAGKLKELLKDPNERVVNRAMLALARVAGNSAKSDIEPLLQDSRTAVRATAAGVYGRVCGRDGAGPLMELMKTEKDQNVRASGVTSLGFSQSWEAMPLLVSLLDDPNGTVRAAAFGSINHILGVRIGYDPGASAADRRRAMDRLRSDLPVHKKGYDLRWQGK